MQPLNEPVRLPPGRARMNGNVHHGAARVMHGHQGLLLTIDDHGAQMDAPDWLPHGGIKAVQMIPESKATYRLLTGHNTTRGTRGSLWR